MHALAATQLCVLSAWRCGAGMLGGATDMQLNRLGVSVRTLWRWLPFQLSEPDRVEMGCFAFSGRLLKHMLRLGFVRFIGATSQVARRLPFRIFA